MFGKKKLVCPRCGCTNVQMMRYEKGKYECLGPGCGYKSEKADFLKK